MIRSADGINQMRHNLDPEKITLVQASWGQMKSGSVQAATLCLINLCATDPTIAALFKRDGITRSLETIQGITYVVGCLDQPERIRPYLGSLGRLLRAHGVNESHQQIVGAALLQTLGQSLGDKFTPAHRGAWAVAYSFISGIMIAESMPSA
jgi:hemoglobin-like flavoprotein